MAAYCTVVNESILLPVLLYAGTRRLVLFNGQVKV